MWNARHIPTALSKSRARALRVAKQRTRNTSFKISQKRVPRIMPGQRDTLKWNTKKKKTTQKHTINKDLRNVKRCARELLISARLHDKQVPCAPKIVPHEKVVKTDTEVSVY